MVMSMSTLDDLCNYIDFLRNLGYGISLSCFSNRFEPFTRELLEYEIHTHSVCSYLKSNNSTLGLCCANKRKLEAVDVTDAYYACCYAGVEEYVIPIRHRTEFLMCVNISGYRGTLPKSRERAKQMAALCDSRFDELYGELSDTPPSLSRVMAFVKPLEYIVRKLYRECREMNNRDAVSATRAVYLDAVRYIHENYMHDIGCESVAKYLNYSPSYMRYIFKREDTLTLSQKIAEVRLENAKNLLVNTRLSITDIAIHCGFCDSNYFSTVFKKRFAVTPSAYRRFHSRTVK